MTRKICNRLQYCYPIELAANDKWRELELISEAELETLVEQETAGHLCYITVRASISYDPENELLKNAYNPIILKGFTTEGNILILGSIINPVLVEYDQNEEAANLFFTNKHPL